MKINEATQIGNTGKSILETIEIVESGSNTNGNYIKFSDGTMICYGRVNKNSGAWTAWGSIYDASISNVATFAKSFVSTPSVSIVNTNAYGCMVELCIANTSQITRVDLARGSTAGNISLVLSYIAIGKWE